MTYRPENKILQVSFCEARIPRPLTFDTRHKLEVLYKTCLNYALRAKIGPAKGAPSFAWVYKRKIVKDRTSL